MALQLNYINNANGIVVYNAYWRINPEHGIIGGKDIVNCTIEVFKNYEYAHVNNPMPLDRYTFTYIPDLSENSDNLIAQAYKHAKKLPMLSGSVDV